MTSQAASSNSDVPSTPQDPELVDRIAEAVLTVPGIGLHGGAVGDVATYLPGRRVSGLRVDDEHVEVHVSVAWGADVRVAASLVRNAVRDHTTLPVDVVVEDVVIPD